MSASMAANACMRRADVPVLDVAAFRALVIEQTRNGALLAALFGVPHNAGIRLQAVLTQAQVGTVTLAGCDVGREYPALTPECLQAHWFEREVWEQWGVTPVGHPWLKPIRFQPGYAAGAAAPAEIGRTNFFTVAGDAVHAVAVGPVHAGIIEPGHFRFECHGEHVLHLEISLGYQHRGIERALVGGPTARTVHVMETVAGDTSIGHALAYAQACEALADCQAPPRAQALRAIALELERLANHTGDLGALANDVGYLPTASFCGRIRGDFLNMTALLCGNRFGRGFVRPGGVTFELEDERRAQLIQRLRQAARDVRVATDLLWSTPSVLARFESTGTLTRAQCEGLGIVGVAARASGVVTDVRCDFPHGWYRQEHVPPAVAETGDVYARAQVRLLEIQHALNFIQRVAAALPAGPLQAPCGAPAADRQVVALVEGWRGMICHTVLTDAAGRFAAYKIVDPSFHNWMGLALAMRGQQISDFPLCNKSFNLSYCGHDL